MEEPSISNNQKARPIARGRGRGGRGRGRGDEYAGAVLRPKNSYGNFDAGYGGYRHQSFDERGGVNSPARISQNQELISSFPPGVHNGNGVIDAVSVGSAGGSEDFGQLSTGDLEKKFTFIAGEMAKFEAERKLITDVIQSRSEEEKLRVQMEEQRQSHSFVVQQQETQISELQADIKVRAEKEQVWRENLTHVSSRKEQLERELSFAQESLEKSETNRRAQEERARQAEAGLARTREALEHAEDAVRQHQMNAKRKEEALEVKDKQLADIQNAMTDREAEFKQVILQWRSAVSQKETELEHWTQTVFPEKNALEANLHHQISVLTHDKQALEEELRAARAEAAGFFQVGNSAPAADAQWPAAVDSQLAQPLSGKRNGAAAAALLSDSKLVGIFCDVMPRGPENAQPFSDEMLSKVEACLLPYGWAAYSMQHGNPIDFLRSHPETFYYVDGNFYIPAMPPKRDPSPAPMKAVPAGPKHPQKPAKAQSASPRSSASEAEQTSRKQNGGSPPRLGTPPPGFEGPPPGFEAAGAGAGFNPAVARTLMGHGPARGTGAAPGPQPAAAQAPAPKQAAPKAAAQQAAPKAAAQQAAPKVAAQQPMVLVTPVAPKQASGPRPVPSSGSGSPPAASQPPPAQIVPRLQADPRPQRVIKPPPAVAAAPTAVQQPRGPPAPAAQARNAPGPAAQHAQQAAQHALQPRGAPVTAAQQQGLPVRHHGPPQASNSAEFPTLAAARLPPANVPRRDNSQATSAEGRRSPAEGKPHGGPAKTAVLRPSQQAKHAAAKPAATKPAAAKPAAAKPAAPRGGGLSDNPFSLLEQESGSGGEESKKGSENVQHEPVRSKAAKKRQSKASRAAAAEQASSAAPAAAP